MIEFDGIPTNKKKLSDTSDSEKHIHIEGTFVHCQHKKHGDARRWREEHDFRHDISKAKEKFRRIENFGTIPNTTLHDLT